MRAPCAPRSSPMPTAPIWRSRLVARRDRDDFHHGLRVATWPREGYCSSFVARLRRSDISSLGWGSRLRATRGSGRGRRCVSATHLTSAPEHYQWAIRGGARLAHDASTLRRREALLTLPTACSFHGHEWAASTPFPSSPPRERWRRDRPRPRARSSGVTPPPPLSRRVRTPARLHVRELPAALISARLLLPPPPGCSTSTCGSCGFGARTPGPRFARAPHGPRRRSTLVVEPWRGDARRRLVSGSRRRRRRASGGPDRRGRRGRACSGSTMAFSRSPRRLERWVSVTDRTGHHPAAWRADEARVIPWATLARDAKAASLRRTADGVGHRGRAAESMVTRSSTLAFRAIPALQCLLSPALR